MKKTKVLIDGAAFENNSQIGIWRLFFEVMSRTASEVDYTLLLSSEPLQPLPRNVRVMSWSKRYDPESRRRHYRRALDWPLVRRIERDYRDAIWHSTFFTADPRRNCLSVVTVFDMIAETGYAIGPYLAQRNLKIAAIANANAILAISNTTAQQFKRFFPGSSLKTQVIRLGHEHLTVVPSATVSAVTESKNYCLFVGGRYAYKNFCGMVEAVGMSEWPSHLHLVVVGAPFDDAEKAWINAVGVSEKIEHVGKVSDEQLAMLYQRSDGFVFPSLMEGFGIPILEAQAGGTVPLLSDIPVFHEVGGSGALYFDPHSPPSIAATVSRLLDPAVRNSLLQHAAANLQRFSWDDAAKLTLKCYRSLFSRDLRPVNHS